MDRQAETIYQEIFTSVLTRLPRETPDGTIATLGDGRRGSGCASLPAISLKQRASLPRTVLAARW